MKNSLTIFRQAVCCAAFIVGLASQAKGQEAVQDTALKSMVTFEKVNKMIDVYGSLRFAAGISFEGEFGMKDNSSRLGLRGEVPIIKGITAITQLEVGVGMIGNKTKITWSGDPGGSVGEVDNVFTSRLGWVGIETKYGSFTWGKQWSTYYDVSSFTDMFNAFGGDASGTYAAGTDGSIAGTGRVAAALQYNLKLKFLEFGAQIQNRQLTDSSTGFADTYGASLLFNFAKYFRFGVAYNQVRDGIQDPEKFQPKSGDKAAVAGLLFVNYRLYLASTVCMFTNHETDNLGHYYSGFGTEFFGQYFFLKKWSVYAGYNYEGPNSDSDAGKYQISYFDAGVTYTFAKISKVFIELKIDDSRKYDGSQKGQDLIGFGMFFNFEY